MKRRITALLLSFGIICSVGVSAVADIHSFSDISKSDYYYNEVLWGVEHGIVSGLTEGSFAPTAACTRGQIATFLWRSEGQKQAQKEEITFTDVSDASYYYDAIVWAVEQGIISGYNAVTFAPEDICTRAQLVTILHRLAGAPSSNDEKMKFEDVSAKAYYHDAVAWAVEQGIANGYSTKTFGSDDKILRCDTVKLLYGYYQLDDSSNDAESDSDADQEPIIIPTETPEVTPTVTPEEVPDEEESDKDDKDSDKESEKEEDRDSDKELEKEEDKDSDKELEKEEDKDSDKDSEREEDKDFDKDSEREEDNDSDKDSEEKEPELSEVDKTFPWNETLAAEVVKVAKSYLEHADAFRYQAGYGVFGNTYKDKEDGKGLIDCSTFVGLVLRGIPYEESRYVTDSIWDNMARTDLYDWADSGLDRDRVRWAYEYADYFIEEERTFEDISSVKPGDILIHHRTDAFTGEETVWHVSMVMEIEEDGDVICIHSLYGKKDVGIYTYRLTDWILEKYGRTIAARPDYAKEDKTEYFLHSWAEVTGN